MPVFHTKTIESILEPVAQQVSKLVILHEEADDGNQMPDLSYPVQVVKKAADNLIKVGYETVGTSTDLILKKELPQALKRVEEACKLLQDAALIIKKEPSSTKGKRELFAGERGILQGVSTILLTFDESEVRKILQICRQVLEYLSITELIEKMDDLVTYVKNLTPILTKMTREINQREQELTHQIHVDLLAQHMNQVKDLTPLFISSIKICLIISNNLNNTNNDHESPILVSAIQNKEFLIKRISCEIEELMRILQLTTHDEDSWLMDLSIIKQKFASFEFRLKEANEWLNDKQAVCGSLGEKSLRNAIDDAQTILTNSNRDHQALTNDLKHYTDDLCSLINQGKKNTPLGIKRSNLISENLLKLKTMLNQIISTEQAASNFKVAPTYHGKLEQAIRWFNNPYYDYLNGEQAARLLLDESKQLAYQTKDIESKQKYLQINYECEFLVEKLSQMIKTADKIDVTLSNSTNTTSKEEAFNLGQQLNKKLIQVNNYLNVSIIQQIADDYLDVNYPIKKLSDLVWSANQDQNINNLKDKFEKVADDFIQHNHRLCESARHLANSSIQTKNRNTIELINKLTNRNIELAPQIVNSAFIVLSMPGNRSLIEHYDMMQQQWQLNMTNLQQLIDESLDSLTFIEAYESSIIRETYQAQTAIQENNKQAIVMNALNIARRTNRIIQVASQEAENSEETTFVNNVNVSTSELKQCLPTMVQSYKMIALENNKENFLHWTQANESLMNSIHRVKESLSLNDNSNSDDTNREILSFKISDETSQDEDLPDLDTLKIREEDYYVIESPVLCTESLKNSFNLEEMIQNVDTQTQPSRQFPKVSKPTPLPDLIEENTVDDLAKNYPLTKINQPILMAAHDLHSNVSQWQSGDNDLIAAAKRITLLMARLSSIMRREENTNRKELISTAKLLADESFEFSRIAKLLAQDCTDKRMRNNLLQNCEKIPTIGTQLKILSTVKATIFKGETDGQITKEDEEATEMLIFCAQNLNSSIKSTMNVAESVSIKLKPDSLLKFRWIKKKKFFNKN